MTRLRSLLYLLLCATLCLAGCTRRGPPPRPSTAPRGTPTPSTPSSSGGRSTPSSGQQAPPASGEPAPGGAPREAVEGQLRLERQLTTAREKSRAFHASRDQAHWDEAFRAWEEARTLIDGLAQYEAQIPGYQDYLQEIAIAAQDLREARMDLGQ